MLSFSAHAQVTPFVTLNALPFTRQDGRAERGGGVSRLIRSIRHAIGAAAGEPWGAFVPRIRSYPY